MNYKTLYEYVNSNKINDILSKLICSDNIIEEKSRYTNILNKAYSSFGEGDFHIISSPGRVEIGGNHTDHQHGNTVSATLSLDNVCVCKASNDNYVIFSDSNYGDVKIDLSDLSIKEEEKNTSSSIVRGIANKMVEDGYKIGGFRAICDSKVLIGASISSSACFELMIVEIFNTLFNGGKISTIEKALVSQYAENNYFFKASGLLDQLTISTGGFVCIDFADPINPITESYDFDFEKYGYKFLIVNTKGDHSNLTNEYSSIPSEMKEVARRLNVDYLADSSLDKLTEKISDIRNNISNDRAILRSLHFYNENKRAILQKEALKNNNIDELLKLMIDSGKSSYMYLQNAYISSNPKEQNLSIALGFTDNYLNGKGAFRLQGGGFEGTIISIIPNDLYDGYVCLMKSIFGDDCIIKASIRSLGTVTIV